MIHKHVIGATHVMSPPSSHPDVQDLHARREPSCSCWVTVWEPTRKEIDMLIEGGVVELWLMSSGGHPPVALQARPPIIDPEISDDGTEPGAHPPKGEMDEGGYPEGDFFV